MYYNNIFTLYSPSYDLIKIYVYCKNIYNICRYTFKIYIIYVGTIYCIRRYNVKIYIIYVGTIHICTYVVTVYNCS